MPRTARVVIPGQPHHVVQRGNRRQQTFFDASDYRAYLRLAHEIFAAAGVEVWSYCLMPNHAHLILTPCHEGALAKAMARLNAAYARRVNRRQEWTGHLWQDRFASYPLDDRYLITCARYIGLNPVRAGLVSKAVEWPWSSVQAHLKGQFDLLLNPAPLGDRLGGELMTLFDTDAEAEEIRKLRKSARTGRPLGAESWVHGLEAITGLPLADPPRGRPRASQ